MTELGEVRSGPEGPAEVLARREATDALVRATRSLMRAVGTSDVPPERLRAATEAVARAEELLAGARRDRVVRIPFDQAAVERLGGRGTWTTFAFNPLGIPLRIELDGPRARAGLTPDALFEGPPGLLHGGFSAAMLDALLGSLVQAHGTPAFTATLRMRYLRPTVLDVPIVLEGHVLEGDGRTIRADGWIVQDGRRTVEVEGLFVQPR